MQPTLSDAVAGPTASGFAYALPGGWAHLDPHPARRDASVRRAVSERVRREPRLAGELPHLHRLLVHECAVAAARGAQRVSLLAETEGGLVVTAAVTFVVAELPDPSEITGEQRRSWTETGLAGLTDPLEHRVLQLISPWPGRPLAGLLTMTSPCRGLWPELEELFDACCETFHWTFS